MIPRSSPSATDSDTSRTAKTPPKDRETCSTSSIGSALCTTSLLQRVGQLLLRPVGRDELATAHHGDRHVVDAQTGVVLRCVPILAFGREQRQVAQRPLDVLRVGVTRLLDRGRDQLHGTVAVEGELRRGEAGLFFCAGRAPGDAPPLLWGGGGGAPPPPRAP